MLRVLADAAEHRLPPLRAPVGDVAHRVDENPRWLLGHGAGEVGLHPVRLEALAEAVRQGRSGAGGGTAPAAPDGVPGEIAPVDQSAVHRLAPLFPCSAFPRVTLRMLPATPRYRAV